MANILFLMRYPLERGDNLQGKFDGQIAAARALGHQAYWIGWKADGLWLMGGDSPERLAGAGPTRLPAYEHTLLYMRLMRAARKAVETKRIDVIYMRYMPAFPQALGALREAKRRGAKLIVEHPTYPFETGKVTSPLRRPVFWLTDRVFERIEPMIDLYALIGEPAPQTLHCRPAVSLQNGVDASRLPLHRPRPDAPDVALLALASMSRWQGYDRLIRAVAGYRGGARLTAYLVGDEGDGSLAEWKRLARELGADERVTFLPAARGAALDELIARCDVGVGGLGLFRRGQRRSTPLKLREYMARGLPFVCVEGDPALPDEPRFCLRVPNDESPLDMEAVVRFAQRVKRDAAAPGDMRRFAEERLSWTGALKGVLERAGVPCDSSI